MFECLKQTVCFWILLGFSVQYFWIVFILQWLGIWISGFWETEVGNWWILTLGRGVWRHLTVYISLYVLAVLGLFPGPGLSRKGLRHRRINVFWQPFRMNNKVGLWGERILDQQRNSETSSDFKVFLNAIY
jgi:hypothetical protein